MRIVVTGGTGFIGRPLVARLVQLGFDCTVLTRDIARASGLGLPPQARLATFEALPPADAVIHLAGENIAGWWTTRKRAAILRSRVELTHWLVRQLEVTRVRPHTLLSASAIGLYGHRPGEVLDETSELAPDAGFRAEVCRAWEAAANVADGLGVRVINLRFGNVLDPTGGLLKALLPVYRWLGGLVLAAPETRLPWVSREDCLDLILFALAHERWYGPLNVTAPEPVSHRDFAQGLCEQLGLPFLGEIPPSLIRGLLGELSTALLEDQTVLPVKALQAGFRFRHPTFAAWLEASFPRVAARGLLAKVSPVCSPAGA